MIFGKNYIKDSGGFAEQWNSPGRVTYSVADELKNQATVFIR